jgi:hypothetical protein
LGISPDISDFEKKWMIQKYAKNNNKNIQTDLIIVDFAKEFDKVPHRRLLYKLKYYGIQENTLLWIQTFLSDRTHKVDIYSGKSFM